VAAVAVVAAAKTDTFRGGRCRPIARRRGERLVRRVHTSENFDGFRSADVGALDDD
jgi:hypothetical protein